MFVSFISVFIEVRKVSYHAGSLRNLITKTVSQKPKLGYISC